MLRILMKIIVQISIALVADQIRLRRNPNVGAAADTPAAVKLKAFDRKYQPVSPLVKFA